MSAFSSHQNSGNGVVITYRRLGLVAIWLLISVVVSINVSAKESESEGAESVQDQIENLKELLQVEVLAIPRLEGTLELDGILDEDFWEQASTYEIKLETYPALLDPSPVKTTVKITRIDDDLVIGFIAEDPEPDKIQAPLRDRDGIELDDYVGVSIDPTGRLLETFDFYVNARGIQGDWVRNRIDDTRARDWDADWWSAAKITEFGYSAEMQIPIAELEISTDTVPLKRIMLLKRHYPRAVRHHLTAITIKDVTSEKIILKNNFIVVPGLTLLNEHSRDPEEEESDWSKSYQSEVSLDLGYKMTSSLGAWATLNPNFLEVEADLTDFNINDPFTPLDVEKRSFFLRGIENFGTPFDTIYTRNIVDPIAGVNVSGSVEDVTTGNFVVYDRDLSLIIPGNLSSERAELDTESLSGAFRYRYDYSPGTAAGLIATVRTDSEDYYNLVGGVDYYKKFKRFNEVRAQWLYSGTQYSEAISNAVCGDSGECTDPEDTTGVPGETPLNEQVLRSDPNRKYSDDALHVRYKYNRREGYFNARYLDVGDDFRSDLGYMTRVDYRLYSLSAGLNHYIGFKEEGKIRSRPSLNYARLESQAGELISESREIWLNHWGLYQTWFRIGFRNRDRTAKRFLQNTLDIEGNSKYFQENQLEYRIETSVFKNFRFFLAGKFGTQIDTDNYRLGDIVEFKPELRWNLTDNFEIGLKNIYRRLEVSEGWLFTENYLGMNFVYHLDKESFFRLTLIDDYVRRDPELYLFEDTDELERDIIGEFLFAWKPTQLNTLFIGAKSGSVDNDNLNNPTLEEMSFYIKFKRAFRF